MAFTYEDEQKKRQEAVNQLHKFGMNQVASGNQMLSFSSPEIVQTSRQKVLSQPVQEDKWYQGTMPTTSEMLARIYDIGKTDQQRANILLDMYNHLSVDPSSPFYEPYRQATNWKAINALQDLGVDVSGGITPEFFQKNMNLLADPSYTKTGMTPSAPSSKTTPENDKAYWFYTLLQDEDRTQQAETALKAINDQINYWVNRTDLNLSDDDILNKIDWKDYKILLEMDAAKKRQNPLQLNRAVDWSMDNLYGMIWAARNKSDKTDMTLNAMNYRLGIGNQYEENPDIRKYLNPDLDTYNPFKVKATIDDACEYFGVDSFDDDWTHEHQYMRGSADATERKMYGKVVQGTDNIKAAEAELAELKQYIEDAIKENMYYEDIVEDLLDGFPTLTRMQKSLKSDLMETSRPIDFDLNEIKAYIASKTRKRDVAQSGTHEYDIATLDLVGALKDPVYDVVEAAPSDTTEKVEPSKPSTQPSKPTRHVNTDTNQQIVEGHDKTLKESAPVVAEVGTLNEKLYFRTAPTTNLVGEVQLLQDGVRNGTISPESAYEMSMGYANKYVIDNYADAYLTKKKHEDYIKEYVRNSERIVELQKDSPDEMPKNYFEAMMATPDEEILKLQQRNAEIEKVLKRDSNKYADSKEVLSICDKVYEIPTRLAKYLGADTSGISTAKENIQKLMTFDDTYVLDVNSYHGIHLLQESGATRDEVNKVVTQRIQNDREFIADLTALEKFAVDNGIKLNDNVKRNLQSTRKDVEYDLNYCVYDQLRNNDDFKKVVEAEKKRLNDEYKVDWGKNLFKDDTKELKAIVAAGVSSSSVMNPLKGDVVSPIAGLMTAFDENEKDIYLYLYAKNPEEAQKYYDFMTDSERGMINSRQSERIAEMMSTVKTDGGWSALRNTALSVLMKPVEMAGTGYALGQMISGKQINPNHYAFAMSDAIQNIREESKEVLAKKCSLMIGDVDVGKSLAEFIYDAGTIAGDSAYSALLTSGFFGEGEFFAGKALNIGKRSIDLGNWVTSAARASFMSAYSFGSSARNVAALGGSEEQAILMAAISFGAELITETIEVSDMYELATARDAKDVFNRGLFKLLQVNDAAGEAFSTIIEKAGDQLVMEDLSDISRKINYYKDLGLSDQDAERRAIFDTVQDVLMDGLMGGVSAGLSETASYAWGSVKRPGKKTTPGKVTWDQRPVSSTNTTTPSTDTTASSTDNSEATLNEIIGNVGHLLGESDNATAKIMVADFGTDILPTLNQLFEVAEIRGISRDTMGDAIAIATQSTGQSHDLLGGMLTNEGQIDKDTINELMRAVVEDVDNGVDMTDGTSVYSVSGDINGIRVEASKTRERQQLVANQFSILGRAGESDSVSTKTATIAAVLNGSDQPSDTLNVATASAQQMLDDYGEDIIGGLQNLFLSAAENGIDDAHLRTAISMAALSSGTSHDILAGLLTIDGQIDGDSIRQLIESATDDINNPAVIDEINSKLYDHLTAGNVINLIGQGALSGVESYRVAVDQAKANAKEAQENLETAQSEYEASVQNLQMAESEFFQDASNDQKKGAYQQSLKDTEGKAIVMGQMQASVDNALEKLKSATNILNTKVNEIITQVRENARQLTEEQMKKQQERKAQEEVQKAQEEAVRQQAQEDARRDSNAENVAADEFIAEFYPNATEEEKEEIRRRFKKNATEAPDPQKQALRNLFIYKIARKFGVNVHIRDTTNGGTSLGYEGMYNEKTNTIELDYNTTESDMLYRVALHELTHMAERSGMYDKLAKSLSRLAYTNDDGTYDEKQLASDINARQQMYNSQLPILKAMDPSIDATELTAEGASKEIVADLTRKILYGDEQLINNFVAEDPSMSKRFLGWLKSIGNKFTGVSDPAVAQMSKTRKLFEKALKNATRRNVILKASDNEPQPSRTIKNSSGEDLTVETRSGAISKEYSLSSWTPEEQETVRKNLTSKYDSDNEDDAWVKEQYATKEEWEAKVNSWIDNVNSVAAIIASDKDRLDYDAAPGQTYLKPNMDYYKTLDASTLCAKRLLYQGTFNQIQHALKNTVLTPSNLIDLLNMMKDAGYEKPCDICYVESRRTNLGVFAKRWLNSYEGPYKPTLDEVTTTDGLDNLRKTHPEAAEAFIAEMNRKGPNNPKVVQLRTDYKGEIRSLTDDLIKKIKRIGGLRMQSFSDFETPHLIDTMQALLDMVDKGLTAQAYTKVPAFAKVFGESGVKINLSLIGEGNGLDADGNLIFSDKEGMPHEEAFEIRKNHSKNVGTILVGMNDAHILKAMADDRIDYIIPFHRSGWSKKQRMEMRSTGEYQDYTNDQHEKYFKYNPDGSFQKTKQGKYKTQKLEKGNGDLYPIDYWDPTKSGTENAKIYLQRCKEEGRIPKFSRYLVDNGDGSFSLQPDGSTDGYWKTLIDFKMYDNEGNFAPQEKVTFNVDMDEAQKILQDYDGNPNELPYASDVVEKFVEKYKNDHPKAQYSLPSGDLLDQQIRQYLRRSAMPVQPAQPAQQQPSTVPESTTQPKPQFAPNKPSTPSKPSKTNISVPSGAPKESPQMIAKNMTDILHVGGNFGTNTMANRVTDGKDRRGYYQPHLQYINVNTDNAGNYMADMHEIGHAIGEKLGMKGTQQMVSNLPAWFHNQYTPQELENEAFAEFVWRYMEDEARGRNFAGDDFVNGFEEALRQNGIYDDLMKEVVKLRQWVNASTLDKMRTIVHDKSEKKKQPMAKVLRSIEAKLEDATAAAVPINDKIRSQTGGPVNIMDNIRSQALLKNHVNKRLNYIFEDGLTDSHGNIVGDSMASCFKGLNGDEDLELFNLYGLCKHAIDRDAQDKAVFDNGTILPQNRQAFIDDIEKNHKNVAEAFEKFQDFRKQFIQTWMVNTGFWTQELFDRFNKMYPAYVPTYRVKEIESGRFFLEAKGSTEDIINPLDSFISMMKHVVKMNLNNNVGLAFHNAFTKYEGMGEFGKDITGEEYLHNRNKNAIAVRLQDGSKAYYEIYDPDLYRLLAATGPAVDGAVNLLGRTIGRLTRGMSALTTGSNPVFAIRNFLRDFQNSVNYGSWALTYFDGLKKWVKAFAEVWSGNSLDYQQYKALGGGGWTRINPSDAKSAREIREMLVPSYGNKGIVNRARNTAGGIWSLITMERLNEAVEQASRFAEYKYGKHDLNTESGRQEAFLAAQDVTVDFSRNGNTNVLNVFSQVIPFLKASTQGVYRTARMLTDGAERSRLPARMAKTVFNTALASAIANLLMIKFSSDDEKKDFENMNDNLVSQNFFLPNVLPGVLGNRPLLRIPVGQDPFMYAVHGAVTKAMWYGSTDQDVIDIAAIANTVIDNINPVNNPVWSAWNDVNRNRNWYGSKIVPTRMESNDWESSTRYTEETADIFINASRAVNAVMDRFGANSKTKNLFSPLNLQYLAEQYTGYVGQMLIPAISKNKYTGELAGINAMVTSVRNRFTTDPLVSNEVVNAFYDNSEFIDGIKAAGKNGMPMNVLRRGLTQEEALSVYDASNTMTKKGGVIYDTNAFISECYDEIDKINANDTLSDEDKYELTTKIRRKMINQCLIANQEVEKLREAYVTGTDVATAALMMGAILELPEPTPKPTAAPGWKKKTNSKKKSKLEKKKEELAKR